MVSLEFFIYIILQAALWPWSSLSLWQKWVPGIFPGGKGGRCIGLTTLPTSCAECLKIWEPQPPGNLRACNGIALPFILLKKRDPSFQTQISPIWVTFQYSNKTLSLICLVFKKFTKLRNATIRSVMYVCLPVCLSVLLSVWLPVHLHGNTRLSPDGFSWNLIF